MVNGIPLPSPMESGFSDDENDPNEDEQDDEGEDENSRRRFAFPELDQKIRDAVARYGGVFPKLNFSSPRVCPDNYATYFPV